MATMMGSYERCRSERFPIGEKLWFCAWGSLIRARAVRLHLKTMTISRREFLATAALSIAATRLPAQRGNPNVTLKLPNEATGAHMPADFVGLSYEVQQLVDSTFFSGSNAGLIRQFKALAPQGVLRLGGN